MFRIIVFLHSLYCRLLGYACLADTGTGNEFSGVWEDLGSIAESSNKSISGAADSIVNLMLTVLGIAGIVATVIGFVRYAKNEGSDTSLAKVGIGVVLAVVIIFTIKAALIH